MDYNTCFNNNQSFDCLFDKYQSEGIGKNYYLSINEKRNAIIVYVPEATMEIAKHYTHHTQAEIMLDLTRGINVSRFDENIKPEEVEIFKRYWLTHVQAMVSKFIDYENNLKDDPSEFIVIHMGDVFGSFRDSLEYTMYPMIFSVTFEVHKNDAHILYDILGNLEATGYRTGKGKN